MKTVKIILKFKFLTLFSDKIIQCYTESTVYTIITLFLYGIGALLFRSLAILQFHYYIIPIWNWSFHCALAYAFIIRLHYSYMELELEYLPSFKGQ